MEGIRKPLAWRLRYFLYLSLMRQELPFFVGVRRRLIDALLGRNHDRLAVFPEVFINKPDKLSLGDNVSINRGCHLSCAGGLVIGSDVAIGHNTTILTSDHSYEPGDVPIKSQSVMLKETRIGSNVLIGARAIILGGVKIADGTAIAAGAVVTRSITEPNTIVGGVPARKICDRERPRRPRHVA